MSTETINPAAVAATVTELNREAARLGEAIRQDKRKLGALRQQVTGLQAEVCRKEHEQQRLIRKVRCAMSNARGHAFAGAVAEPAPLVRIDCPKPKA